MTSNLNAAVGCNHKSDLHFGKEMISIATVYRGADALNLQRHDNCVLLPAEQYNSPHPHPASAYGVTYGQHREYLEFDVEEHRELRACCEEWGISYSTSAWDFRAFQDICLLEIKCLSDRYGETVKSIGFSGYHLGIAALALGAEWIERHYTLDRTWKGTDHAASLEPDGVRKLARDIKNVAKAITFKHTELLPVEVEQHEKLKRNVIE
jgi:sialic acid synthase SpsE